MLDTSNLFYFFLAFLLHTNFKELFHLLVCNFLDNTQLTFLFIILCIVLNHLQHETLKHVLIMIVEDLNEDPGQQSKAEHIPAVR